jgi:hypothetical protein
MTDKHSSGCLVTIFTIFVVTLLVFSLIWRSAWKFHDPAAERTAACKTNLKRLGLALHNYHDDHGSFPPPYIADKAGRPMHSWRVLLLPYLSESAEQQTVLREYRFDESWDGPHNRKLHDLTLKVFRCPSDASPATETTYVAVVGATRPPGRERVGFAFET